MHGGLGFLGLTGGDARYDTDEADAVVLEVSTGILGCGEYSVLEESPRFRYLLYLPCCKRLSRGDGGRVWRFGWSMRLRRGGVGAGAMVEAKVGEPASYAVNMIVRLTLLVFAS
ncbi:hypothetical protein PTI98_008348 [Pleurotus ostreatus]|nr:hypothetical protein PTI98_008348 [Pleurotus ostreatus]